MAEMWNTVSLTLVALVFVHWGTGMTAKVRDADSLRIYYDTKGAAVPMLTAASLVAPTLKTPLVRFGPLPCSCHQLQCGCCVNMRVSYFSFERQACTNFTYDPNKFAVEMNMLWNQESLFNRSISGRNPPPVCIPVPVPPPYLPSIDMCVRLFNIHTPGYNINMCMNLETRIERVPVLVMQFDCMKMGLDGVMLLKPETEAEGNQTATEASPLTEETTEVAQEEEEEGAQEAAETEFDPVDDDKKKVNQTSSVNSNSTINSTTNIEIETQGEESIFSTPESLHDQNLTDSSQEIPTSTQFSSSGEETTINLIEFSSVNLNQSSEDILPTTEAIINGISN